MGKKGSWLLAIRRVFSHSSKEKVVDGTEKKSSKEKKKKGLGRLKHGDGHSFIPLSREPSSIEKILGEAEREHHIIDYKPLTPLEHPKAPPHVTPPPPLFPLKTVDRKNDPSLRASPSHRKYSTPVGVTSPPPPRVASPLYVTPVNIATPAKTPPSRFVQRHRPEPTLREHYICATKIQAAYRGYTARRNYRALRSLVRLQGVVKSQSVKRQTASALKCMQLMVCVQNQVHMRRIQMLENEVQRRQAPHNDKHLGSAFGKWNLSDNMDEWEDSALTKEEIDARIQRKVDAIIKRERAMAYAYCHQLWKTTPGMAQAALMEIRLGGFPYWWNREERRQAPPLTVTNPSSQSLAIKTPRFTPTPTRSTPGSKASLLPFFSNLRQPNLEFDNMDTPTPRSTKSAVPLRAKLARTPPGRLQQNFTPGSTANSPFNGTATFKDDDSLMSCPSFSVPHYMAPTVSAKAKVRTGKERVPDRPSSTINESKRRVSLPFGQAIGSFKWKNKESSSRKASKGKNQSVQSLADHLSVDSTVSMPFTVGKKPFNRFV